MKNIFLSIAGGPSPKKNNKEIVISDMTIQVLRDSEMFRVHGQRKWYAPWLRYPDTVFRNITASVLDLSKIATSSLSEDKVYNQ